VLPPGPWCYAKLYGGRALADRLLVEEVAPLVRSAMARGACDSWFFVRYEDPEPHLRVRVRGDVELLVSSFLPELHASAERWRDEGLIWKLQLDTYEREIERYGGLAGLEISEAVFAADSEAVLAMLTSTPSLDERWKQTLLGMHHLLQDVGATSDERIALLSETERRLGMEFHADVRFWKQLGARFRSERPVLEELLEGPVPAWLRRRSRRVRRVTKALRNLRNEGGSVASWEEVVRAYVHLHVNRACCSESRAQELMLVGMLLRLEKGARERTGAGGA
jgi:thiopeptide-type bacteriocin biosynthesis protein